jgi:ABC transport system ATP-binding/permease protein
MSLINCQNLSMSFGGPILLDNISLIIGKNERVGLLGRNGEGKSTLLKILNNEFSPNSGRILRAASLIVSYLPQNVPADYDESTVAEIIKNGLRSADADKEHHVERLCTLLMLEPEQHFSELSGGQKRRTLLGKALACDPDLLILDEPTNHLDIDSIKWLENFLSRFNGSILFVTHDRSFLQNIATRILELDRGNLTSWECDYPTYLKRKKQLIDGEMEQWAQFDKKLAKEEAWIRQGIKARRTRNEGRVRALEKLRDDRRARREQQGEANIRIHDAQTSGRKVITAKNVFFSYDNLNILSDFSTSIIRGDKIGIIGDNGCGKTTLLNILLGKLQPQSGTVKHGSKLEIAYFDQHRHELNEKETVFENLADGGDTVNVAGKPRHVISYLEDFLFSPERSKQPVYCLSGGERNRLLLAKLFVEASNVLVLDEPTNDLDAETLELLEMRLLEYQGTILVVSHDRMFLDNICTKTIVFENGEVNEYVGGYSDWQFFVQKNNQELKKSKPLKVVEQRGVNKKLSNKEREEWNKLPDLIMEYEMELEKLQILLADPDFFKKDPYVIKQKTERATKLPNIIDASFERWEELDQRK